MYTCTLYTVQCTVYRYNTCSFVPVGAPITIAYLIDNAYKHLYTTDNQCTRVHGCYRDDIWRGYFIIAGSILFNMPLNTHYSKLSHTTSTP